MNIFITVDSIQVEKRGWNVKASRLIKIQLTELESDEPIKQLEAVVAKLKGMIKDAKVAERKAKKN